MLSTPLDHNGDPSILLSPQDELVQALRSDGRRQAAQRMLRVKRSGGPKQQQVAAPPETADAGNDPPSD